MKKALIIVLIIISFRLVFSGQTAGEAGAGGYGCPVSETTGGRYAVRSVQGANFGCDPHLVSSCTPLNNDEDF